MPWGRAKRQPDAAAATDAAAPNADARVDGALPAAAAPAGAAAATPDACGPDTVVHLADDGSDGGSSSGSGGPPQTLLRKVVTRSWWQEFFESHGYHSTVIFLVVIDLMAVIVDLGLTLAHCPEPHLKPAVEEALEALTWISIGILCIFIVEFAAQLLCFGLRGWCRTPAHLLDMTVVVASLVLELVLRRSDLKDVVALLIVFRLWRIVRVLHATEEIMHIESSQKVRAAQQEAEDLRAELEEARAQIVQLRVTAAAEAAAAAESAAAAAAAAAAGVGQGELRQRQRRGGGGSAGGAAGGGAAAGQQPNGRVNSGDAAVAGAVGQDPSAPNLPPGWGPRQ